MKLEKCPKCGSTNIKQSSCKSPDGGYVGYCACQECYYTVKSTNDFDVIPDLYESPYKAKRAAMQLWNEIITISDPYELRGHIDLRGYIA